VAVRAVVVAVAFALLAGLSAVPAARATGGLIPQSDRSFLAVMRYQPDLRLQLAARGLQWGAPVMIRVFKESRELEIWLDNGSGFSLFWTFGICSVSGDIGPKLREGDGQAPEGFYFVRPEQLNPDSEYHLSVNLGFPNSYDRAQGRTGSMLMIHGDCVSRGCFAITDPGIERLWALVHAAFEHGQPAIQVQVFPFRLTDDNLARHAGSRWHGFWRNLKQGYDLFEATRQPPGVTVIDGRYVFYAV
jgi:murein L,D-transpeptidase YafK